MTQTHRPLPNWRHERRGTRRAVRPAADLGTAGLRGPMRDGPNGMNVATVLRTTWAVAQVLTDRGLGGSTVVVGRDARHHSDEFALAAAEVFAAEGFSVSCCPTRYRRRCWRSACDDWSAAAGVQITASHNPPADNGYKVYFEGGMQIVSPTDREIEAVMAGAAGRGYRPRGGAARRHRTGRALHPARRRGPAWYRRARIALTPLHGVGGEVAIEALCDWPGSAMFTRWRRSSPQTPTSPRSRSPTRRNQAPPTRCWLWRPKSTPTSRSPSTPMPTGAPSASHRHRLANALG